MKTDSWPMWILFFILLTLKLMGIITWSWWWVTLPLWGGLIIVGAILIVVAMIIILKELWYE